MCSALWKDCVKIALRAEVVGRKQTTVVCLWLGNYSHSFKCFCSKLGITLLSIASVAFDLFKPFFSLETLFHWQLKSRYQKMNRYDEALYKVVDTLLAVKECVVVDDKIRHQLVYLLRNSEYPGADFFNLKLKCWNSYKNSTKSPFKQPMGPTMPDALRPATSIWSGPSGWWASKRPTWTPWSKPIRRGGWCAARSLRRGRRTSTRVRTSCWVPLRSRRWPAVPTSLTTSPLSQGPTPTRPLWWNSARTRTMSRFVSARPRISRICKRHSTDSFWARIPAPRSSPRPRRTPGSISWK